MHGKWRLPDAAAGVIRARHPSQWQILRGKDRRAPYEVGHTAGKTAASAEGQSAQENVQKQTSQNDYKHENIQTQRENGYCRLQLSSLQPAWEVWMALASREEKAM